MSDVFGPEYAASYDALYADKDYDAECDLIEGILHQAGRPTRSILDLGCGTGAHAVRLAARGYDVVGVDLSEDMLRGAMARSEAAGAKASFVRGDIRTARLGRQFDAVISMFAVLGYQTADDDVADALQTVRAHLVPGGTFLFDVWYGPAVEAVGPTPRTKRVPVADGELERQASASLEPGHICVVSYRLVRRRHGALDATTSETHRMRYFFEDELALFLERSAISLTRLAPFPDVSEPLSATTWNALGVGVG